jgi:hypothetical protein
MTGVNDWGKSPGKITGENYREKNHRGKSPGKMTGVFCPAKGRKWKLKVWPREKDVDLNGRQV